jgi:hypothetical protein
VPDVTNAGIARCRCRSGLVAWPRLRHTVEDRKTDTPGRGFDPRAGSDQLPRLPRFACLSVRLRGGRSRRGPLSLENQGIAFTPTEQDREFPREGSCQTTHQTPRRASLY